MQEPQPIDWEYYRKGIGPKLVDMYKEAYESRILLPLICRLSCSLSVSIYLYHFFFIISEILLRLIDEMIVCGKSTSHVCTISLLND